MSRDRTGRTLEETVGRIQQMLEPGGTITYRERIKNRLGIAREFDVVLRGRFAGHAMLVVIECKDWGDKVGTPEVDAFNTKSRDVNANVRLIVSPKGFTGPALVQARDAGIGVYSLLPNDPEDTGFAIGVAWYGRAYSWSDFRFQIHYQGEKPAPGSYSLEAVLYGDRPLVNWFLRELSTTHLNTQHVGQMGFKVGFGTPIPVAVLGRQYAVAEIHLHVERVCRKKTRFMQITGDAFFDWHTGSIVVPEAGKVDVNGFRPDLPDWDDFDDEFPQLGRWQVIVERFFGCIDLDNALVPDLPVKLDGPPVLTEG
jgi:hypothetical protein